MQSSEDSANRRVQIWSQNYDPEPQGVAPIVGTVARGLAGLGREVTVVTAHPHYPEPAWGTRARPYRELRDGIPVYRLPIWAGRDSGLQRIRQDLSSAAAGNLAAPFMPPADAVIAVSPSLPGLSAAMNYSLIRRVPWILWLQDIVTDGAVTTGELPGDHPAIRLARAFEAMAYRSAAAIVVISGAFRSRLLEQGVPEEKISLVYNPMTRDRAAPPFAERRLSSPPRILAMGNVGRTQGLEAVVEAFESDRALADISAEMLIAGSGVALEEVRGRIRSERVLTPGVVDGETLDGLLESSHLGLVSQKAGLREFNLPSKLMNYMSFGVPVIASVDAGSETARIVTESGAGWVTDPARPEQFAARAASALSDPVGLRRASAAGIEYAARHFHPAAVSRSIDDAVRRVTNGA
jgi:colanic acid biosynthesis glycosyl transferase WcaI